MAISTPVARCSTGFCCAVPVTVAGIDSDRFYPVRLQEEIARLLGADLHILRSPYGHDGFLLETEAVGRVVRTALGQPSQAHA